jgi:hypothetical protein
MKKFLALALFSVSITLCAQDTIRYSVLSAGKTSGQQWIIQSAPNSYTLFYEFNDRGRGPGLTVNLKTDDKGIPIYLLVTGFDYYKAPVHELYEVTNGEARWKSATENDTKQITAPSLYSPINSTPAEIEWMLQAALQQKNHQIETLPSGFLQVKHIKNHHQWIQRRVGIVFIRRSRWTAFTRVVYTEEKILCVCERLGRSGAKRI